MKNHYKLLTVSLVLILTALACRAQFNPPAQEGDPETAPAEKTRAVPTPIFAAPVQAGLDNPDEPTSIIGEIPYTSRFFEAMSEPFVMLEDQAGFVKRDKENKFALAGQVLGPIERVDDQTLSYQLSLPAVPQGEMFDLDQDGEQDAGVQVFAVALWDNTWGDPFLEARDGRGWSNAYASTVTDPNRDYEIQGGTLVVWAPDDQQSFPTGFGGDGKLFTEDDPTAPIPAGYSLVDLNAEPFQVSKEARPVIDLIEGVVAVNDFSEMDYPEAFEALFSKVSEEYPFTADKEIDWPALYQVFQPQFEKVRGAKDFYNLLRDFAKAIPDGHIGVGADNNLFSESVLDQFGGGYGLIVDQTSDGRVFATQVLPGMPADEAGIESGAEIITWDGKPVQEAVDQVDPFLAPYSTEHAFRLAQLRFLTRTEMGEDATVEFKNPGQSSAQNAKLEAELEYDTLNYALEFGDPELQPVEASVLQPSGLGYIRVRNFSDDYHLTAKLWDRYIKYFQDTGAPGIVIDLRQNGGGSGGLANNFAGYFYEEEFEIARRAYFNSLTGKFEYNDNPEKIEPGSRFFDGPVAVLVGPNCMSACEGFAYALQQNDNVNIVGSYPSGGLYGEVGRGQYKLPDGLSMQFPTGRPEDMDGNLIIEGTGVVPDIQVPVTVESLLGQEDTILEAAIKALLAKLQ